MKLCATAAGARQNARPCSEEDEQRVVGAPKGIRIPVFALKGQCPRPLDDGGDKTFMSISETPESGYSFTLP